MFLVIKSADEMYIFLSSSVPKIYILECSKYLPTILFTVMFSVYPLTPAIKQQMPLITKSIFTPFCDASINFSIRTLSVKELNFIPMYPSLPSSTFLISPSIKSAILFCMHLGIQEDVLFFP